MLPVVHWKCPHLEDHHHSTSIVMTMRRNRRSAAEASRTGTRSQAGAEEQVNAHGTKTLCYKSFLVQRVTKPAADSGLAADPTPTLRLTSQPVSQSASAVRGTETVREEASTVYRGRNVTASKQAHLHCRHIATHKAKGERRRGQPHASRAESNGTVTAAVDFLVLFGTFTAAATKRPISRWPSTFDSFGRKKRARLFFSSLLLNSSLRA